MKHREERLCEIVVILLQTGNEEDLWLPGCCSAQGQEVLRWHSAVPWLTGAAWRRLPAGSDAGNCLGQPFS